MTDLDVNTYYSWTSTMRFQFSVILVIVFFTLCHSLFEWDDEDTLNGEDRLKLQIYKDTFVHLQYDPHKQLPVESDEDAITKDQCICECLHRRHCAAINVLASTQSTQGKCVLLPEGIKNGVSPNHRLQVESKDDYLHIFITRLPLLSGGPLELQIKCLRLAISKFKIVAEKSS